MALAFSDTEQRVTIYALSDPRKPDLIRYIGKTKHPLGERLGGHKSHAHRKHTPKNDWVLSLKKLGLVPRIWPIEICGHSNWEERERFWIKLFRSMPQLLNLTDGGDSGPNQTGFRHSEETKRKIALAGTGRKMSPESIKKRRVKMVGFKMPPEAIRRMSESRRGKPLIKACEAARRANLGKTRPPEVVAKVRAGMLKNMTWRKPVTCVTTGEQFSSVIEAARKYRCTASAIPRAIRLGIKARKMKWSFNERVTTTL